MIPSFDRPCKTALYIDRLRKTKRKKVSIAYAEEMSIKEEEGFRSSINNCKYYTSNFGNI